MGNIIDIGVFPELTQTINGVVYYLVDIWGKDFEKIDSHPKDLYLIVEDDDKYNGGKILMVWIHELLFTKLALSDCTVSTYDGYIDEYLEEYVPILKQEIESGKIRNLP